MFTPCTVLLSDFSTFNGATSFLLVVLVPGFFFLNSVDLKREVLRSLSALPTPPRPEVIIIRTPGRYARVVRRGSVSAVVEILTSASRNVSMAAAAFPEGSVAGLARGRYRPDKVQLCTSLELAANFHSVPSFLPKRLPDSCMT